MNLLKRAALWLADTVTTERPQEGEQYGAQDLAVSAGAGIQPTSSPLPVGYDTYRTMRRDPTIALARALSVAPVVAGEWMVEADDEIDPERIKFIQDMFVPIRESFIETALLGGCDFGWSPFEKVYESVDGKIVLKKLKPLLHDLTTILVDTNTGAFAGFRQGAKDLPLANSLLVSFRVEGTMWYGSNLLENIRATYNQWVEANDGAARYDKKLAGVQPVLYYPHGDEYVDSTETPNKTLAREFLQNIQAGNGIAIPQTHLRFGGGPNDAKQKAWEISLLADDTTRQPGFTNRLDYLDKLKARGLQWPERAILEGMFGTKAEAGEHRDIAMTSADLMHRYVTRLVNWHVVDSILALNYGEEARGTIRLAAAPLNDTKLAFLREMIRGLLQKESVAMELFSMFDIDGMLDSLGVPKSEEVLSVGDRKEPELDIDNEGRSVVDEVYAGTRTNE